ncbi:MAG: hypothetical protein Q4D20_10555, partial [Clostridia bacterium]|nr:hypothetical protein [Clostridia bacterium]
MKKHHAKKTLSLFLALLMLITAVPLTAVPAAAAGGTLTPNGWAIISSNGQRVNTGTGTFTVCNDGTQDAISVGFIDFDISEINGTVSNAKLTVAGKNTGDNNNYNTEAFLEIFSIPQGKRPNVSGATSNQFGNIFGTSGFYPNTYDNANNAKNTLGVLGQPAIGVMKTKDMHDGNTATYNFDISEAINKAKNAGQNKLCLAFLNPKAYRGSPIWSDINVYYNTANITYTEVGTKDVGLSKGTALYNGNGGNTRGSETRLTVCNDGSANNTVASFVKFDISGIPSNVASVVFSTNVSVAGDSNSNAYAEVYSVAPNKYPASGNEWQTTNNFDKILSSGGSSAYNTAKDYFSDLMTKVGTLKTSQTGSISFDITEAVRNAKNAGQTELCLMLINPQSYNNGSGGWSDIYINPQQTKLVCKESTDASSLGNFGSGLYYLRLTYNVPGNYWDNNPHKAYYRINYKKMNGTGEEATIDIPINKSTFNSSGDKVFDYVIDGYPTSVKTVYNNMDRTKTVIYTVTDVKVGYAIDKYPTSPSVVKSSFNKGNMGTGTWSGEGDFATFNNDGFPYAKTFDWKTSPAETFVPYVGSNSVSAAVVAKDQYGVVMGTEYTATVQKFAKDNTISPITSTGLTVSQSYKSDYTVNVADSARVANTDYFYGRLTVDVADANTSQVGANSRNFKIINQKETVTIDPNGGELSNTNYQIYYGSPLNAEINKTLNGYAYPPTGTREGYALKGIYSSATGTNKIADDEKIWSNTSYYAQWQANVYTVTFLDADGNVFATQPVEYGKGATAPVNPPKKAYDAENHYDFTGWDTDFSNVKSDLTVSP